MSDQPIKVHHAGSTYTFCSVHALDRSIQDKAAEARRLIDTLRKLQSEILALREAKTAWTRDHRA